MKTFHYEWIGYLLIRNWIMTIFFFAPYESLSFKGASMILYGILEPIQDWIARSTWNYSTCLKKHQSNA